MLGALIAIFSVSAVVVLTMIRREIPLFILIAIFVLTSEFGEGFTSFQASIFFNQGFLDLANLKLVEVILYTYTGMLLLSDIYNRRKLAPSSIRRLYWFWLAWLVVLLFVQIYMRDTIDPFAFRGVYFGWALLYVFASVVYNRQIMQRVMVFTLVLISVRGLWQMLIFAIGGGDVTARGRSPLFFDDKLLEAFVWALFVFFVMLLQQRDEKEKSSWLTIWVAVSLVVIAALIIFSLRRNYLGQVAAGIIFVLFNRSHKIQLQRFLPLALFAVVVLGVIIATGQIIGDRLPLVKQMNNYLQMLDFTSASSFTEVEANQVHVENVQSYIQLLVDYEGIRYFGRSAAPTDDFRAFNREYLSTLGLAHNGPLRAIFDFGIGGLIVWAGFFLLTFLALYRCQFWQLEAWERAVVTGSTATVFGHFAVTLTFVPPFFTSLKGFFFFFLLVYIIEFYSRESRVCEAETNQVSLVSQPADNYTSA